MWILIVLILLIAGVKLFDKMLPYLLVAIVLVYGFIFVEKWWLVLLISLIAGIGIWYLNEKKNRNE
ncbi:hypothetical protein [Oenococcus oeni]|uniref:Uncharacterized protein n=1 Tax=Oenococcus oeni TaxID=1247 RepID=A0A483BMJ5_OENOE|nr:hypothetical protein [Oenococcus oeni]KGI01065.1 hypothetical protein X293_07125 [Oenococcus oeni IOEB_C52]OIK57018.1 hypothetical protein ATW61_04570 [Oenococcus oeni]OIK86968.1 hypothetical protein ATW79_04565 [Oenococcus oeni]OIL09300.1 hypothetical protein ATW92_04500 [Oenococcus oeni]OIL14623.1 hypothetical protein ATW93_04575 [Oenococcus oeni]